jgi:mono/diheme cytochrome c family protein
LVGLAIVLAAGFLASTTPGAHEQPDWPFPWRPSLAVMTEPELRREVVISACLVGACLAVVAASLVWRRGRAVAVLLALGVIAWQAPSLGLLVVDAYPTSFYASPTGFNAAAIVHGQALYAAQCADCHGTGGQGDGPASAGLRIHPADLTAGHLWDHPDGDLFWWIGHGMRDPEGGLAMPGFAAQLSEADRWDLIDYIRANNAGTALRMESARSLPPAMPVRCAGNSASQLSDLRGKVVLVITAAASHVSGPPVIPPQDGFPVVALYLTGRRSNQGCVAETPDARAAFAITAGLSPSAPSVPGYLVDPDGWLRAILPQDQVSKHPERLVATIRTICDHLGGAAPSDEHAHHH